MNNTKKPTLYIFSGLPGSGKSTLSQKIAKQLNTVYLRVDSLEQTLRDVCQLEVTSEGYCLSYKIAADNLRLGMSVISDACNPIELTRRAWEQVAIEAGASYVNIEIICSDAQEHRRRIESRTTAPESKTLTWSKVENREYHPWTGDRIVIDTAHRSQAECVEELLVTLSSSSS